MKKITALILSVILCCGLLFGCGNSAVSNQTSPKDVKNVKWTTYDYSFSFDTTKDWYWKKIKKLEKALDKACKFISGIFNDHEDERIYWEKEDWKKYLLED